LQYPRREERIVFAAPGGVPVIFDDEGVSQIIGDLMEPSKG
jgi:hypothetical protein